MPGGLGKIQPAGLIYFRLHHARDDLFGGVLNSYYVPSTALGDVIDVVFTLDENTHPEFGGLQLNIADLRHGEAAVCAG